VRRHPTITSHSRLESILEVDEYIVNLQAIPANALKESTRLLGRKRLNLRLRNVRRLYQSGDIPGH
jgi:hypothetical protein